MWIPQRRNSGELGNGFLEQLQSFASQHRRHGGEPSEVSPWPREAVNQPSRNRIRPAVKNNRNRLGSVLAGYGSRCGGREEYVHIEAHQLVNQSGKPVK